MQEAVCMSDARTVCTHTHQYDRGRGFTRTVTGGRGRAITRTVICGKASETAVGSDNDTVLFETGTCCLILRGATKSLHCKNKGTREQM